MAVRVAGKEITGAHAATGGTGIVLVGIAAEALRLYSQATEKVGVVKEVAFDKAEQAGMIQLALDKCVEQQEMLMELVRQCSQ